MNEKRIRIRKLTKKKWRKKPLLFLCISDGTWNIQMNCVLTLTFHFVSFSMCSFLTRVVSNWSLDVKSTFFLYEKIMSWLKGSKNKIDRHVQFNCQQLHNRKLNYEAKMRAIRVSIEFHCWHTHNDGRFYCVVQTLHQLEFACSDWCELMLGKKCQDEQIAASDFGIFQVL